jgi:hypothetical protein
MSAGWYHAALDHRGTLDLITGWLTLDYINE